MCLLVPILESLFFHIFLYAWMWQCEHVDSASLISPNSHHLVISVYLQREILITGKAGDGTSSVWCMIMLPLWIQRYIGKQQTNMTFLVVACSGLLVLKFQSYPHLPERKPHWLSWKPHWLISLGLASVWTWLGLGSKYRGSSYYQRSFSVDLLNVPRIEPGTFCMLFHWEVGHQQCKYWT